MLKQDIVIDLKVTISGVTYNCAAAASNVPREEGWPAASPRRVGKGYQYVYYCTNLDQADSIAWHLEELGSTFAGCGDDPDMGRDGRACLKDAARIREQLKAIGH